MKNIITILITISIALILMTGCSEDTQATDENGADNQDNQENNENNENQESTDSAEETTSNDEEAANEGSLTEEDAVEIAEDVYNTLISTAGDNDWEGFSQKYHSSMDESLVTGDFEYFKSAIQEGLKENTDIGIMFHTDEVIGASFYQYTNLASGGSTDHSSSDAKMYLEKEDNEWKYSGSDKVQQAYDEVFLPKLTEQYGEDYLYNGFASIGHVHLFHKVLTNNINVQIYRALANDDGSVSVDLAFENGLDNDIYNLRFNKLLLKTGANDVVFADLSGYSLDSSKVIYSKELAILPLTVAPEDLLIPVEQLDLTMMGVESNSKYTNRDN